MCTGLAAISPIGAIMQKNGGGNAVNSVVNATGAGVLSKVITGKKLSDNLKDPEVSPLAANIAGIK